VTYGCKVSFNLTLRCSTLTNRSHLHTFFQRTLDWNDFWDQP